MPHSLSTSLTHPSVDRRLRSRLILFLVIAAGLLAYLIYDVFLGDIAWWMAIIALIVGILIGTPLGRLRSVVWDESKGKAVSRMDVIGVIALIAFGALDASRDWLLGHFFSGPTLAAIALAVLSGALFGRFYGMHINIVRVLSAQQKS